MSFRKEEKIKIHRNRLVHLMEWIYQINGYELYKPRIVSSTYFDNDDYSMFHDSEEGTVPRKKIRVRSYSRDAHTSSNSSLEVKISSVEGRYKTSNNFINFDNALARGYFDKDYGVCKPRLRVTYIRSYYKILNVRLTIDRNIEYQSFSIRKNSTITTKDPSIAVEIKASDGTPIEYLVRNFPFDRTRFSKYSRAVTFLKLA